MTKKHDERTRHRTRPLSTTLVLAGIAILFAQRAGSAPEPEAMIGSWLATWPSGTRQELRIDGFDETGRPTGTFCGVRDNDKSVFYFDLATVKVEYKDGKLKGSRWKNNKQHFIFQMESNGKMHFRTRRNVGKWYRTTMIPASEENKAACIHRIVATNEPFLEPTKPDPNSPFTGTWSTGDGKTEARIAVTDKGLTGTTCYTRKDGSVAWFDFSPDGHIKPEVTDQRLVIVRTPFKAKMTHQFETNEGGSLRYRERVRSKDWRYDMQMNFDPDASACIGRIHPVRQ